ncbi:hypothetical protein B0A48_13559 [Cryoendolithus antarcticus]|uniref:GST C-terminal domain-containing protein n=1 Tax=Cryoendolithus antarcticus TaxID=1507870 RepID=A0A1V8SPP6_9PEZI|nr:hypothetical protein B0A48_13559 [Cryoendolithus antarcticus]
MAYADSPKYTLLYHPGIPGRAEFIRLAFEATGTPYTDLANSASDGYATVRKACIDPDALSSLGDNPPVFAPPALQVKGEGKGGGDFLISQTSNILSYLGPRLGLAGEDEADKLWVGQVVSTALDLNNEVHDTHHPIAIADYYENQKDEALKKTVDFRKNRLPKFFGYFERMLKWNEKQQGERKREGVYLLGSQLTMADLVVWQVLDGLFFAFPEEMKARTEEFGLLLGDFYGSVKGEKGLKGYLESERRMKYSMGIFRHYPELDRQS